MADRSIAHSIAETFHLESKNMITRTRYRQRAIQLGEALATMEAWYEFQREEKIKSYFSESSWATILSGLKRDIERLNKLAQEGE